MSRVPAIWSDGADTGMTQDPDDGLDAARARFQCLHELVEAAYDRLEPDLWNFLVGGGGTETTLLRNRGALDRIALRPRVLTADVPPIDLSGAFFGQRIRVPVALSPIGVLDYFHPKDGSLATASAAAAFGVPYFHSSIAGHRSAGVAAHAGGAFGYQFYADGTRGSLQAAVDQAGELGYQAFCLTVDGAVRSRRERDIVNRFQAPWLGSVSPLPGATPRLTWDDIDWLRPRCRLPLLIKGIATAEDATLAVEHGVDGVYVSNHGGRQLDHGCGAIDVLPEVVDAVGGRAQVIVDGGFCRGTDVVKAIARGADLVCIGRLYAFALAAAGYAGVYRALELLQDELHETLGLLGVSRMADLRPAHLHADAFPVRPPDLGSAFPLLRPSLLQQPPVR